MNLQTICFLLGNFTVNTFEEFVDRVRNGFNAEHYIIANANKEDWAEYNSRAWGLLTNELIGQVGYRCELLRLQWEYIKPQLDSK